MVSRSADVLAEIMSKSDELRTLALKDPKVIKVIADGLTEYLPTPALVRSSNIYMVVVVALGLAVVLTVAGVLWLTKGGAVPADIPDAVTALGSAAIGALAGLLAPSPGAKGA